MASLTQGLCPPSSASISLESQENRLGLCYSAVPRPSGFDTRMARDSANAPSRSPPWRACTSASISPADFGRPAVSMSGPAGVTATMSSIRMPIFPKALARPTPTRCRGRVRPSASCRAELAPFSVVRRFTIGADVVNVIRIQLWRTAPSPLLNSRRQPYLDGALTDYGTVTGLSQLSIFFRMVH